MNILLAGASGQLGQELMSCLKSYGSVLAVDREEGGPGSMQQDLTNLNEVEILLNRQRPDIIINAAAYTAVDKAEEEDRTAFRLNAELPGCLARWCQRNASLMLHYSTDYVFDGAADKPYCEGDSPGPLSVYGESKLAGEWAVGASRCQHIILRTSWVYSTHGSNFVLSMLRLARQRSELSIVSDQVGCPTWARNLAGVSCSILKQVMDAPSGQTHEGVFHYCDDTVVSWFDFASLIFEQAAELGLLHEIPRLKAIRSTEFPQTARRPAYSVLNTSEIREKYAVKPPGLEVSLKACLKELKQ
jgi:dTDP-4-dehydrorhamnose reductase